MSWCQVTKKLPPRDGVYLVHAQSADPTNPLITVAWFNPEEKEQGESGWSLLPGEFINSITHWQHLPKPPKVEALVVHK